MASSSSLKGFCDFRFDLGFANVFEALLEIMVTPSNLQMILVQFS